MRWLRGYLWGFALMGGSLVLEMNLYSSAWTLALLLIGGGSQPFGAEKTMLDGSGMALKVKISKLNSV